MQMIHTTVKDLGKIKICAVFDIHIIKRKLMFHSN